jgi:hypothetical protein
MLSGKKPTEKEYEPTTQKERRIQKVKELEEKERKANISCCARFFPGGQAIANFYYGTNEQELRRLRNKIREEKEKEKKDQTYSAKAMKVIASAKNGLSNLFSSEPAKTLTPDEDSQHKGKYQRLS